MNWLNQLSDKQLILLMLGLCILTSLIIIAIVLAVNSYRRKKYFRQPPMDASQERFITENTRDKNIEPLTDEERAFIREYYDGNTQL